jgi:hypothetical protein
MSFRLGILMLVELLKGFVADLGTNLQRLLCLLTAGAAATDEARSIIVLLEPGAACDMVTLTKKWIKHFDLSGNSPCWFQHSIESDARQNCMCSLEHL